MVGFTPYLSLAGGILIGLAAIMLLYFNGRVAGLSGIVNGILRPARGDVGWRVVFIAGLLSGALLLRLFHPEAMQIHIDVSVPALVAAGILVGLGTRIGNGCTSGHGVCGVGRLVPRSIVASGVFVATGIAATYVIRHIFGGI